MASHRTTLILDEETQKAARELAARYGCSFSEAIRRAVLRHRASVFGVSAESQSERVQLLKRLFELFEGNDAAVEIRRLKSEDEGFKLRVHLDTDFLIVAVSSSSAERVRLYTHTIGVDMARLTRRSLLKGAAAAPLAGAASLGGSLQAAGQTLASKFTLSVNLELMFPRQMPYAERIAVAADQGCTAFSFWELPPNQAAAMEGAQRRHGLKCGSITGNGKTGWSTGLTRTGFESAFLEDFKDHIEVAKRFNVKNLVCFLGVTQKEISLAVQHAQVIEGLKKVGDIAARNDVYFCLEPLSIVHHPEMSVHTARHGFRIVQEVNHPHVRLDYDVFHVQLSEGNIINNLREGLRRGWIRFVEIGDPPDRQEPGTGETNYANVFKTLREEGFADFVGLEHGTSSTPEHAIRVVKGLAGV